MSIKKQTVARAAVTLTVFSLLTRAVGFGNKIFLGRAIGAEGLGLYQVVCSVFSVLLTITSSGIPITVSKQTARLRAGGDIDGGHSAVSAAVLMGMCLALVMTVCTVLFKDKVAGIFSDPRCMPIFMVLLPAIAASAVYSSYRGGLWGQKNFTAYSLCEFLEELLLVGTGVILVSRVSGVFDGAKAAATSVSISYIAAALITVCVYFYYDGKIKNPRGQVLPLLKAAAPVTGVRVISSVMTSLLAVILPLRLMAGGLQSGEALAEFGIASGMTLPLLFLPGTLVGSLAMALIPELSSQHGNKAAQSAQVEKALSFAVLCSFATLAVFLPLGTDIGKAVFDEPRAGVLLAQSAFLMVPMCLSQISSSMLSALGREVKSLRNYVVGAVFMLAAVWFLPPLIGIYSMIVGFGISFSVSALLNILALYKEITPTKLLLKDTGKGIAALLPSAGAALLLGALLKTFLPLIIAVILAAVAAAALFLFLAAAMNMSNMDTVKKRLPRINYRKKERTKNTSSRVKKDSLKKTA